MRTARYIRRVINRDHRIIVTIKDTISYAHLAYLWEKLDVINWEKQGKRRLSYSLKYKGEEIFAGTEFFIPEAWAVDSDHTMAALLGHLSVKPGDTDVEHFDLYSPEQLEFVERFGDLLSEWSAQLDK